MNPARILVVDDEPGILRAVDRILGTEHTIIGTRSSRDALSLAASVLPDLAIVDIRMPDLDGFELMARLKARFHDLDVILMTGSVDDLDEKLVRAIRSPAFFFIQKPFDREVLRTLVDRCLELRWRRQEHRQHLERLETEMSEARAFQRSLLPPSEARINDVAISCRYAPSANLGGDLVDYVAAGTDRTALLIADVSGHGVSAAMLTAIVKSAFHASHVDGFEPSAVVDRVAAGLAAFSLERFVTLIAALVPSGGGELRYVNAGHPPFLLWGSARTPLWLESTGPIISPAFLGSRWDVGRAPITPGDQLLLYTDGVSEILAERDGDAVVAFSKTIAAAPSCADLVDAILDDVRAALDDAPQPDDLTLLAAQLIR
ncbi:MAG TPA: SpoIIE family protein phosphatase [Vicinamibacterales bacterium]|jgi:sigma-B regulation protein RsbU (phosphoserine phosphatase)